MRHVRGDLVDNPANVEWATEDVCGLGDTGESILDAFGDLFLIEYCRKARPQHNERRDRN
jgi:hypothetical protein